MCWMSEGSLRRASWEVRTGLACVIDFCADPSCCSEHEKLKPLLAETLKAAAPVSASYASLEQRTTGLLQRYNDYVR